MKAETYEIIIETLAEALEMEKWRKEQAEKEVKQLQQDLVRARNVIAELQKENKDA